MLGDKGKKKVLTFYFRNRIPNYNEEKCHSVNWDASEFGLYYTTWITQKYNGKIDQNTVFFMSL